MSKRIIFNRTGGAEVLEIIEHNEAAPQADEVQICVHAIGLNRAEIMYRNGQYVIEPQFPAKLGYEAEPLSAKQLAIVPIAFFSARGELPQLKTALEQGLNQGLTVNELREVFTHQYAYAGFPRALNGLLTLENLVKERAEKGIQDPQGKAASKLDNVDYYQLGTQTLSTLGQRDSRAILWNNEGVDYALKSHLFGYLFSRDNFSPINREIVTVGTLAGFETVQNQLRSHLNILKNLGLSKDELKRITAEITKQNPQAADKANKVVDKL